MESLISALGLEPNIEGGFFRQTFESAACVEVKGRRLPLMNTIYYLLTQDSPVGYFHRNKHDITHFYHLGRGAHYLLISPEGGLKEVTLGPDLAAGQCLSFTAPGGCWKSSHLAPGAEFCLISEVVSPGFDYADHEMASLAGFAADFPHLLERIKDYVRP